MRIQNRSYRRSFPRPRLSAAIPAPPYLFASSSIATSKRTSSFNPKQPAHPDSALLAALLEHLEYLPLKIFIKDTTGRYLACNSAFAHHFGLSTKQILGCTDRELYGSEKAARIRQEDQALLAFEETQQSYVTTWHNGIEKLVHVTKRPWRDHHGRIAGLIGSVRNITAQKQAELKLRELAYEAEELYQRAPCGYQTLDSQDHILRINDTLLSWLNCKRADVLNTSWLGYLSSASQHRWKNYRQQLENFNEPQEITLELNNKHGLQHIVQLSARARLDSLGQYLGAELMLQTDTAARFSRSAIVQQPAHCLMDATELAAHFEQLQARLYSQQVQAMPGERRSSPCRRQQAFASQPQNEGCDSHKSHADRERRRGVACRRAAIPAR